MHYMLCEIWEEIWEDERGRTLAGSWVKSEDDKFRTMYEPNAKLVHSFYAYSDHDFWRQLYSWEGRGEWQAESIHQPEHFFTEEEVAEQQRYLQIRGASAL